MRINKGAFVQIQYRLLDSDGELIEATTTKRPLEFIYGMGLLLPAFEAELSGLEVGDKFDFNLAPKDAYGEINDDLVMELEKSVFQIDGKFDEEVVYEGAKVPMTTADGQVVHGLVTSVNDHTVDIDFNHDLAGEELHFVGEVTDVREPSKAEYESFFNNHQSCSGCSGDCSGHHHHDEGGCCCGGH